MRPTGLRLESHQSFLVQWFWFITTTKTFTRLAQKERSPSDPSHNLRIQSLQKRSSIILFCGTSSLAIGPCVQNSSWNKYFAKIKIQFWCNIFCIYRKYRIFRVSNFAKILKSEYSAFCRPLFINFQWSKLAHVSNNIKTYFLRLEKKVAFVFFCS